MKKYLLPYLALALTTASFASEDKPKVSICHGEECTSAEEQVKQMLQDTRSRLASNSHNNPVVLQNFDALATVLNTAFRKEKSITAQEVGVICSGIEFAAEKHRLQTRKNKERTPYISHPLGVTYNLMKIGEVRDSSIILGALLHDITEDTQTTLEEIEGKFGKEVATLIGEVAGDKSLAKESRNRLQVINAAHASKAAAQIKLADKLFNLHDLYNNPPTDWTQKRIDQYYEWSQSVIDRLPKANDKLQSAVEEIINNYWEKQSASKA